jgi:hypothetical protein
LPLLADTPQSRATPNLRRSSNEKLFFICYQLLAADSHDHDRGWHGACNVVQRADAHTLNQLNIHSL